jgi:hypothetical protein
VVLITSLRSHRATREAADLISGNQEVFQLLRRAIHLVAVVEQVPGDWIDNEPPPVRVASQDPCDRAGYRAVAEKLGGILGKAEHGR